MSVLINKDTKVIAFEPLPDCFDKLKIIEKNYPERFKSFNSSIIGL